MEQKFEFICEWITGNHTITEPCRSFEISRIPQKKLFFYKISFKLFNMRLFIKLRPFQKISLLAIFSVLLCSYGLTLTTTSWINWGIIFSAAIVFVFHQVVLAGYKTNKSGEAIDKQVIDFKQVKYGEFMSFEEKIYMEQDDKHTYYYSEMLVTENVYAIFSIFRLPNLKKYVLNYEKSNLSRVLREINS